MVSHTFHYWLFIVIHTYLILIDALITFTSFSILFIFISKFEPMLLALRSSVTPYLINLSTISRFCSIPAASLYSLIYFALLWGNALAALWFSMCLLFLM